MRNFSHSPLKARLNLLPISNHCIFIKSRWWWLPTVCIITCLYPGHMCLGLRVHKPIWSAWYRSHPKGNLRVRNPLFWVFRHARKRTRTYDLLCVRDNIDESTVFSILLVLKRLYCLIKMGKRVLVVLIFCVVFWYLHTITHDMMEEKRLVVISRSVKAVFARLLGGWDR